MFVFVYKFNVNIKTTVVLKNIKNRVGQLIQENLTFKKTK